MQKFIFYTGIYNILLGAGFLLPVVPQLLGIQLPNSMLWLLLPAAFVIYLGVVLIFCARNLRARAAIVYWDGLLRLAAFLILVYFGFFRGHGVMLGVIGVGDLIIGLVYLGGLPKALNVTSVSLLTDNVS